MITMQDSQQAFMIIERLAPLCATEGVDEETKKEVNILLREMLSVVRSASKTMTAQASGLVLK